MLVQSHAVTIDEGTSGHKAQPVTSGEIVEIGWEPEFSNQDV